MSRRRSQVLKSLAIRPDDFVVEIGAGHRPYAGTDLIVEKYPFDNLHRIDDLIPTAPVIKADATKIPLPAKGCDVLFASHVIEHIPEPDRFVEEIKRCSDRVYLEFPSMARELMYAWSMHEWFVEFKDRQLIFYRNDIPQLFGTFFHANHDALFDIWSLQRFEELNRFVFCRSDELSCRFAEETAFEHAVRQSAIGSVKVNWTEIRELRYPWRDWARVMGHRLASARTIGWIKNVSRRSKQKLKRLDQSLVRRLACLTCGDVSLDLRAMEITCLACGASYSSNRGIFDFDR